VTFKVTKGHRQWCHSIGRMLFPISLPLPLSCPRYSLCLCWKGALISQSTNQPCHCFRDIEIFCAHNSYFHMTNYQSASLTRRNAVTWCSLKSNDERVTGSERSQRVHWNVEPFNIAILNGSTVPSPWLFGSTYWTTDWMKHSHVSFPSRSQYSSATLYDIEITCS